MCVCVCVCVCVFNAARAYRIISTSHLFFFSSFLLLLLPLFLLLLALVLFFALFIHSSRKRADRRCSQSAAVVSAFAQGEHWQQRDAVGRLPVPERAAAAGPLYHTAEPEPKLCGRPRSDAPRQGPRSQHLPGLSGLLFLSEPFLHARRSIFFVISQEMLDLSDNATLSPDGLVPLCHALSKNCTLQRLVLRQCRLQHYDYEESSASNGAEAAQHLAGMLKVGCVD